MDPLLENAKASFVASVAYFLTHVGSLRAINHVTDKLSSPEYEWPPRAPLEVGNDLSRQHMSSMLGHGLYALTTSLSSDIEYAPDAIGTLLPSNDHALSAAVPDAMNIPAWHRELLRDNVMLTVSIDKDAYIAIAHNEGADSYWRRLLFDGMTEARAARTKGRILHCSLKDPNGGLKRIQSEMTPKMRKRLTTDDDWYLVTGTVSLLLDDDRTSSDLRAGWESTDGGSRRDHTHQVSYESNDNVVGQAVIRTITRREENITVQTVTTTQERQYCFALKLVQVGIDRGSLEGESVTLTLKQSSNRQEFLELRPSRRPGPSPSSKATLAAKGAEVQTDSMDPKVVEQPAPATATVATSSHGPICPVCGEPHLPAGRSAWIQDLHRASYLHTDPWLPDWVHGQSKHHQE